MTLYSLLANCLKKSNGSLLYIEFINGSSIHFKSAEQGDSVRGFTTKKKGILVVDEAAYINKDWFYSVVVPIANVYKSDIFCFSTPKYKQGLFYELYSQAAPHYLNTYHASHIISFDWNNYDLSKYLTPELLELYRQQLPKAAFTSEYLARFMMAVYLHLSVLVKLNLIILNHCILLWIGVLELEMMIPLSVWDSMMVRKL